MKGLYYILLSALFLTISTPLFSQEIGESEQPKDEDTAAIPAPDAMTLIEYQGMSDWDFFNALTKTSDPNYRPLYEWSLKQGNRIKVIQRLDDFLRRMNESTINLDYEFFEPLTDDYNEETKDSKSLFKKCGYKKDSRYEMDKLYILGIYVLFQKCNMDQGFGKSENAAQYLSYVEDYLNLQRMYITYENYKNASGSDDFGSAHISRQDVIDFLELIANRMLEIEETRFAMYRTYHAKPKNVKAFNFSHGNDFLATGFIDNQDQDMTGNFRFEFSTDWFKARWFNISWLTDGFIGCPKNADRRAHKLKNPRHSMLSYQNISLGGDGFTPYIRYRNNFALADSLYQHDRPFGSYTYLERRKFRLWPKGLIRHNGTFQIGMIGLMTGQFLQAELHKDAVTDAQRVYGWEKQVGNGGRWLMQINHDFDFMLISSTNKYRSIFCPNKARTFTSRKTRGRAVQKAFGDLERPYAGISAYGNLNLRWGGYLTAVTGGLTISTLDFLHQSGHLVVTNRRQNRFSFGWHLELGMKYRYVIHNTMLEGLGYFETFDDDEFDDENTSQYTLPEDMINRKLWMFDAKVVLQWRKMSFYYLLNLNTVEFNYRDIDLNSAEIQSMVNAHLADDPTFGDYFHNTIVPELEVARNRKWYGYGTLGMTWQIE